ncbi:unnamed protein product [Ceutorhynchus assimilis]|uniref:Uncharacterized protein n=1 Tax=Ceutorhynchus assimilis TaxID=467358 RepID=A0A9N9MHE7_9CUCU|nr:unnamed protein product [Ceutorhynchus assimilis]
MSIVSNKSVQGLETPFGGDAIININSSNPTTSQESQDVILEDNAIEFIFENDHEDSIFEFEDTIEEKKASQGKPEEKKRKATTSMESETQKLKQNQSKNWKRYTVQDLKSATDSALNPESILATPSNTTSRRRPRTFVKTLAASDLSEKYDKLVSERLEIANYQKQVLQNQIKAELKEHELRVELLTLQIQREKQLK